MKCEKCGKEIHNGEKNCSECGTNLQGVIVDNSEIKKGYRNHLLLGISLLIIVACALVCVINIKDKLAKEKKIDTIVLKDMVFKYDTALWQKDIDSDMNTKAIKSNNSTIKLSFYRDENNDLDSYKSSLIETLQNDNFVIAEDTEKYSINGIEWQVIKYQKGDQVSVELLYDYEYNVYVLNYTTSRSMYDTEISMFKEIYDTLKYNVPDIYELEEDAKKELLGEWDLGNNGYYVIKPNIIRYYKDNTKSLDNVQTGTYIAKKATCRKVENGYPVSGYVDCIRLTARYSENILGGYSIAVKDELHEYEFMPNEDGTYYINDLSGIGSGITSKIK